jgi:hypothetical protein
VSILRAKALGQITVSLEGNARLRLPDSIAEIGDDIDHLDLKGLQLVGKCTNILARHARWIRLSRDI